MKPCLSMVLCRVSARPAASGPRTASLPLLTLLRPVASNDASSWKNLLFGISGRLSFRCYEQVAIFSLSLLLSNWHAQTTFYITESSAFKNKMLYFRQDDWGVLCAPLIERLTSVTFSKLEEVPPILSLCVACLHLYSSMKPRRYFASAN